MKRKIFAVALIMICLSLAAYSTLAYFSQEIVAHNVITSGEIKIEIHEWANEEKTEKFPENGVFDVMPGTKVTKIVEVENVGTNPAYVRLKIEKDITLANQSDTEPDVGLLKIELANESWTLDEDGYYYYNVALQPGAATAPLFTYVEFDARMGNLYQNCIAKVDVTAQAVQAANNGSDAESAVGWPE